MAAGSSKAISVEAISELLSDDSFSDSDVDFEYESENSSSDESSEVDSDDFANSSDDESLPAKQARVEAARPRGRAAERAAASAASRDRWKEGDFEPQVFPFIYASDNCGINYAIGISTDNNEFDIFKFLFDQELMAHLVSETNKYNKLLQSQEDIKAKSKLHSWYDVTVNEMFVFLATCMLMALQKKRQLTDYWSTDPLIATPMFGKIMSSNRFHLILRSLHFSDNQTQVEGDKLFKIRPIVERLKRNFGIVFYPHQKLVIDESLMLWKGRLSFKQFIPSKRHRFGIKLFILCDCKTGFIVDFIVYTGATTEIVNVEGDLGISGAVVMTLMERFLRKGHILYTDNWYTSPALAEKLHEEETGTCGTVKYRRKGMPVFPSKLKKGEMIEKHTKNLLSVKWHDRRDVHMLSSVDKPGQSPSGKKTRNTNEDILKPTCVVHYNKNMGAIDKSDMQLSFVECTRKTVKWYKKFFFHLLDISVYNAYVLHKEVHRLPKLEFSQYRLELIRQILREKHQPRKSPKGGRALKSGNPLRLTERHFPEFIPSTEKKMHPLRKCHVCAKTTSGPVKRRETRFMCKECDVPLCAAPCFGVFHTKLAF